MEQPNKMTAGHNTNKLGRQSSDDHNCQIWLTYFIVSSEISVYLVKIKVVSITSELIPYHFTSELYHIYFHSSLWTTLFFFIVSEVDLTSTSDF